MPRANKTFSTSSMTNVPQNTASYGKHLPSQSRPAVRALDKPLSFYIPKKQSHNQSRSRYSPTPNPKTYTSKRNPRHEPSHQYLIQVKGTHKRNFQLPRLQRYPLKSFKTLKMYITAITV